MLNKFAKCSVAALLSVPYLVFAQIVNPGEFSFAQPLISRDEAGFSSCGLRMVVTGQKAPKLISYDFSVVIFRNGTAAGKAGRYVMTDAQVLANAKPVADLPRPIGFWVAEATAGKVAKAVNFGDSASKGFGLGAIETGAALDAILATLQEKNMQFSIRYAGESVERIYSFTPSTSLQDKETLSACFQSIGESAAARAAKTSTQQL